MARDTVHILFAMFAGFAVGCAIIGAAGGQSLAVMRPSVDMALQYQPAPMQRMQHRGSVVVNAEANKGRREAMAGTFGLLLAARNRGAVALPEDELKGELQKAEDFTNVNKVQYKKGYEPKAAEASKKPGSVEVQPLLVPAVVVGAGVVIGGVPALLNAGQTAKDAQDENFGRGKKGR